MLRIIYDFEVGSAPERYDWLGLLDHCIALYGPYGISRCRELVGLVVFVGAIGAALNEDVLVVLRVHPIIIKILKTRVHKDRAHLLGLVDDIRLYLTRLTV